MTEVRSQIAGADEDAVNAIDSCDGLNLLHGGARFNLHQHACIEMRVLVVAGDAAVVVGARGDRDSADAERRIARGGHGMQRFFDVLHKGNEQRACSYVKCALDGDHVVPRHAKDGLGRAPAHGLQLLEQQGNVVGRVLAINHDPVKTRAGNNLRGDSTGQAAPQAHLALTLGDRLLECVAG